MKKVSIIMTALMLSAASYAQQWSVDKAHSKLGFTVTHLMINDVDGMFKNFDATVTSSKPDFSDAQFNLTAQVNSVFTDNDKRDEHLKSADFFDAANIPTLSFVSKSVKKDGDKKLKVTGDLTIHGVTKTVTFDVTYKGPVTNPMSKKQEVAFKLATKIKRADFKIGASIPEAIVSDEVTINANGEFSQG
jgi:polyisoprenoid-binding protein YceI